MSDTRRLRRRTVCALFGLIFVHAIAHADEPRLVRITADGFFKQRPAWSPDGKNLVYARHQGATIFLYLRNLKTGQEERLTNHETPDFDAVFSPDGKSLLFAFDRTSPGQGNIEIFVTPFPERKPAATTASGTELSHEEWPSWSPDGKRFAFTSTRHGNQELYVAAVEGGDWRRLTSDPAVDAHPAWSSDGKTIAFATSRWGDLEIALLDPEGQDLRRLTHSRGLDEYPAWSPDGRRLAFVSNRDGNLEIYVQAFGENGEPVGPARNVSQHEGVDSFPAWTPDGRLGFVSNREDGFEIYTLRVDD